MICAMNYKRLQGKFSSQESQKSMSDITETTFMFYTALHFRSCNLEVFSII